MISAEQAISRIRRSMTLGQIVRFSLLVGMVCSAVLGPLLRSQLETNFVLLLLGVLWAFLTVRSARGSQLTADFPYLIASGDYQAAETRVAEAAGAFNLFRPPKLLALHQLAVLRHAQNRYRDSALLCRELLAYRLGRLRGLGKSSQLMLAQSLLELGDVAGAGEQLTRLRGQPMSAAETMNFVAMEVDHLSRLGQWAFLMEGYMARVQVCEVMQTPLSARTQALLALAARNIGRHDVADWLTRRAELLHSPQELVAARPFLAPLWPGLNAEIDPRP